MPPYESITVMLERTTHRRRHEAFWRTDEYTWRQHLRARVPPARLQELRAHAEQRACPGSPHAFVQLG